MADKGDRHKVKAEWLMLITWIAVNSRHFIGRVVQLDRISDFGSEGWGFESSRGHELRGQLLLAFFISVWLTNTLSVSKIVGLNKPLI